MTIFNINFLPTPVTPPFLSTYHATVCSCFLSTLIAGASVVHADVIELTSGDLLTGTISAINKDGATIDSAISDSPLEVRAAAIKRMTFSGEEKNTHTHPERITLVNGDSLPCQVLSMNQDSLRISTWYAGNFEIARKNIRSLRFGLSEERNIYTGNDAPSKWDTKEGSWTMTDGTYTGKGSGVLARELDLPENVRIRFNFAWKDTPNFVFRFCGETDTATTKQDTYELIFNSAGMQIRRYQGNRQYAPIANIDLKPHEVSEKRINIDLRVNRRQGTLTLYLDGNKIDTWPDTFETAEGNHIIFNNRASRGSACIISDLQVSDWNDGSPSRHSAKIAQSKMDVLIDSEGEKISGHIAKISQGKTNKRTIQFDVKHSTKPLMVPDRRVSILYFSKSDDADANLPKPVFTAHLNGYGSLQLEQPKLKDGKVITHHPILGPCTLDSRVIASITQSKSPAKKSEDK